MKKETLFRKFFCENCCYLEDESIYHEDEEDPKETGNLICNAPCTKECVLENWQFMARAARKFVIAETKWKNVVEACGFKSLEDLPNK